MSKIYVATFGVRDLEAERTARAAGKLPDACAERIAVECTCEGFPSRAAAYKALEAEIPGAGLHSHTLEAIGEARVNGEGLTFGEWLAATRRPAATRELTAAWAAGEDPTDHAAAG